MARMVQVPRGERFTVTINVKDWSKEAGNKYGVAHCTLQAHPMPPQPAMAVNVGAMVKVTKSGTISFSMKAPAAKLAVSGPSRLWVDWGPPLPHISRNPAGAPYADIFLI